METKTEGWPEWTATLLQRIERGDFELAANMLACCTNCGPGTDKPGDRNGRRNMFMHPEVIKHAKILWEEMVPSLTPDAVPKVRAACYRYGW